MIQRDFNEPGIIEGNIAVAQNNCKTNPPVTFFTVCSICKKARIKNNIWKKISLEDLENPEHIISHGLCPDCMTRHYADIM